MPQKILRLGLTECSLLFIYWLNNYKKLNNQELTNSKKSLILFGGLVDALSAT
jgi:hypothetical protein